MFPFELLLNGIWVTLMKRPEPSSRDGVPSCDRPPLRVPVDLLPDPFCQLDAKGVVLAVNRALTDVTGLAAEALLGHPLQHHLSASAAAELNARLVRVLAGQDLDAGFDWAGSDAAGRPFLLSCRVSVWRDEPEGTVSVLMTGRDVWASRQAQQQQIQNSLRLRAAFEASPVAVAFTRLRDGCIVDVNPAFESLFGWPAEASRGRSTVALGLWADASDRDAMLAGVARDGSVRQMPCTLLSRNGRSMRHQLSAALLDLDDEPHLATFFSDVSDHLAALDRYQALHQSMRDGYARVDETGHIVECNRALGIMLGYDEHELEGLDLWRITPARWHERERRLIDSARQCEDGQSFEKEFIRKDGSIFPVELQVYAVNTPDGAPAGLWAIVRDITERKRAQEKLDFLAYHDPLTGLPNRALLLDRLEHAMQLAIREGQMLGVMFVDLDRFKVINDTLGHPVGDRLLIEITARLRQTIRSSDTLARLGGDEFVVLIESDVDEDSARLVAEKIVEAASQPVLVDERELFVSASVGICLFPRDGSDVATLLKHADIAMYRAKEEGRSAARFYRADMSAGALERMAIEGALRGALRQQELSLHYQPQVSLISGELVGAEALVRWTHPKLGSVSPGLFIPIAEDIGLIDEIGMWVLDEACRQIAEWHAAGFELPSVSVNVSVKQIEARSLAERVAEVLARYRLPARMLELEVTESMIMRQTDQALEALYTLSDLGVSLAVDDFGTGYSSLAYLKKLPVDLLKVDYSFVRDIGRDPNDEAITRAIISMGASLGLTVVAEGIERFEQQAFLVREGCTIGQGYLFDRPIPAQEFAERWWSLSMPGLPAPPLDGAEAS